MSVLQVQAGRLGVRQESPSICHRTKELVCLVYQKICSFFKAILDWVLPINPITNRRGFHLLPACIERALGRWSYLPLVQKSGGEITETHRQYGHYAKLVKEIGQELTENYPRKDLEFEFKLINSNVDNAWCLPGGKIGINIGLILNMENETVLFGLKSQPTLRDKIAAVLSHEITHAGARHSGRSLEFRLLIYAAIHAVKYVLSYRACSEINRQIEEEKNPWTRQELKEKRDQILQRYGSLFNPIANLTVGGLSLHSSRRHELEADKFGMHLVAKKKGDEEKEEPLSAAIWLMHFFKTHHSHDTGSGCLNWITHLFSSHPTPEERLQANLQTFKELTAKGSSNNNF